MSERGVFAVDRGIWDHDVLCENAPFSRREAWLWLVSEAAWKPHKRRIIGRTIELKRGEYVGSLRFMASKWRWSEPKVRRFLAALISSEMVDAKTDAGVTVISICKYDEYQRVSLPTDAMRESDGDAGATQERRKVEDMEDKEIDDAAAPRASAPLISEQAHNLAEKLLILAGHNPDFWPPAWCGAALRVQKWISEDWPPDIILSAAKACMAKRGGRSVASVQFFENAIAEEIARQAAPLPTVEVREATKLTVNAHEQTRDIVQATHRLRGKIASFAGRPASDFGVRSREGDVAPPLISHGGRERP